MNIQIQAVITAPLEVVWNSWVSPQDITKWNFASDDWHCPTASNELKVGGKYSARMEAKDGSFGFDLVAIYNEVEKHKKLVYTLEDNRVVRTTFEPSGESTKVTTVFEAEKVNPEEMQRNGWQAILNNFKQYVETKKGPL